MNTLYKNTTEDFIFTIIILDTVEFIFVNRYGSDTFLSMDLEEAEIFFDRLGNLHSTEDFLKDIGVYSRRCSIESDGENLMIYRQKALWDCDACAYLEQEEVNDLVGCFFAFTRFQEAGEC